MIQEHREIMTLDKARYILQQLVPKVKLEQNDTVKEQIIVLTDEITDHNIDAKKVMEEQAKKKYQYKLIDKISQAVALNKVKISKLIDQLEPMIAEAITLVQKMCTLEKFTKENSDKLAEIDSNVIESAQSLTSNADNIKVHHDKVIEANRLRQEIWDAETQLRGEITELKAHILPNLTIL